MSRNCFFLSWSALLFFFLAAGCLMAQETPPSAAVDEQPAVAAALKAGNHALEAGKPGKAAGEFEKADRLAQGKSFQALIGLATAKLRDKGPAGALDALERARAAAAGDLDRGILFNLQGLAWYQDAGGDPGKLAKAATALEQSVALGGPAAYASLLTLAYVREGLNQAELAAASVRELLGKTPANQAMAREARVLLCQMRLRHPEISPPARTGEPVRPEDGGDVIKPVGLSQSQPRYSTELRARRVQGRVIMQAVIDREGCVAKLEMLHADHPDLAQPALQTVATWVFEPASLGGTPVDVYYSTTVSFRLQ